jgi:hypothetical protein
MDFGNRLGLGLVGCVAFALVCAGLSAFGVGEEIVRPILLVGCIAIFLGAASWRR